MEVDSGDDVFVAEGEEILLTSGAMKSPQILILSGVGPADHLQEFNIPLVRDLPGVGQNLRDHPLVTAVYKAKGESPDVNQSGDTIGPKVAAWGQNALNVSEVGDPLNQRL